MLHSEPAACSIEEALRNEYRARKARNLRFSVRAFALQLGVDSASLSQIMSGRRRLSWRAASTLLQRLGHGAHECRAVAQRARLSAHERRLLRQIGRADFVPHSQQLARRLRLSVDEVNAALTGLLRKGGIRMISSATWTVREETQ